MKKKLHVASILFAVLSITLFTSCKRNIVKGKGEISVHEQQVESFDAVRIDIMSNVEIMVEEGSTHSFKIKTHDNIIDHIKTEVQNGRLRIFTRDVILEKSDITLIITTPELKGLDLNGAPDALVKGVIKGEQFDLDIAGASEVVIEDVEVQKFNADMSGASELKIDRGATDYFVIDVAGSAEIDAVKMKCARAKVDVSGAGEISLYVTDNLDVDITGAGNVDYKGKPEIISNITGAGDLRQIR